MEVKRDILWRVYMCFIAIAIICIIIFSKAFYIQQVQGKYWRSISDSMHEKIQEIDAERGTIYSDDGQMLSTSIPQFDVYIDFKADGLRANNGKLFKQNLDSLSYHLSLLFKDKSKQEYKRLLTQGYKTGSRYYMLRKKVSFKEYQQLQQFPLIRLGKNKSGFIVETKSIRLNPYQLLAYRTIGLDRENAQKVGLEKTYDTALKGTVGKRLVRYLSGGVAMPVGDDDYQIEPENGKDIVTNIDMRMQEIVENALMNALEKYQCAYGTSIVMETKTGKIKAIANLGQKSDGSYWEDYNYAMRTTEPGSTIKLATLLSVLSEGKTTVNEIVNVGSTGSAFVGVRNVTDDERAAKPLMTVKECFAHSSNVGMSKVAYENFASQPAKFRKYLHQLRLDSITGIDLIGEEKPRLPKFSTTNEGLMDMVTMSFGYAIQISPLQTLTLYNAVANNGRMMKPYLVNAIKANGIVIKQFEPTLLRENISSPAVIKDAQDCMNAVTTIGTAKAIFLNSPYPVAGKTGTAHVADGVHGYHDGIYQATFVGYFPSNAPQFTCIVVMRTKPFAALHFGAQLAAPLFKEISDKLYANYVSNVNFQYANAIKNDSNNYAYAGKKDDIKKITHALNISYPDSSTSNTEWSILSKQSSYPVMKAIAIDNNQMPQLLGLALKDAVFICENMGLKVKIKGKGKVIAQSITAGQNFIKGQSINILLN